MKIHPRIVHSCILLTFLFAVGVQPAWSEDLGGSAQGIQGPPTKDGNNVLGLSLSLSLRGDVVTGGVGLRGTGSGAIQISGIPAGAAVIRSLLYWVTIGNSGTFTSPKLNGHTLNGRLIGSDADTCWGAGGNFVYRSDVTSIVNANGTYTISGLPASGPAFNDSQGASLVVIYRHNSAVRRGIIIQDGATVLDVNFGPTQVTSQLGEFSPSMPSDAQITFLIGDGQSVWQSGDLFFDGMLLGTDVFFGTDGDYWDTLEFDISAFLPQSPANASLDGDEDCLVWAATVLSIAGEAQGIFSDGFESGSTLVWSSTN